MVLRNLAHVLWGSGFLNTLQVANEAAEVARQAFFKGIESFKKEKVIRSPLLIINCSQMLSLAGIKAHLDLRHGRLQSSYQPWSGYC